MTNDLRPGEQFIVECVTQVGPRKGWVALTFEPLESSGVKRAAYLLRLVDYHGRVYYYEVGVSIYDGKVDE